MLYVQVLSVAAEEEGILIETAAFANFELCRAPIHQTFASVIEADINERAFPKWHLYCDILQGLWSLQLNAQYQMFLLLLYQWILFFEFASIQAFPIEFRIKDISKSCPLTYWDPL